MNARVRDPLVLLLALGLVAALAVALQLASLPPAHAERLTAIAVLLVFVAGVLLSSANGLVLLFLLPPLFNGEDQRPYFFLLEVLVYLTLATGFATHLWRRRPLVFPHAPLFILFLLSTVISLPFDLKEMWLETEVASWREILDGVLQGELAAKLFYVRTVLNVLSGIALYVLVVNERWVPATVARLAVAVTALSAGVTALGVLLYWVPVAPEATFLTVWLGGELTSGFTGLGFNVSYFAQYALAYLPLAGVVLVERAPHWAKALAVAALLVTPCAILATYQRGAYVVLLVEFGLLALAGLSLRARTRPWIPLPVVGVVGGVLLSASGVLLFTPVGSKAFLRFLDLWRSGDPYREHVLGVAWRMFLDQPLLGVGSGRFAHMFQFYSTDPASFQWGSLSSHSLYAQVLAEQGALGLLSFLALLAVVPGRVLRAQARLRETRPAVLFLLVSLGAWLTYGWLQYTFLLRSMQLYFWITLGLLTALAAPAATSVRVSWRWVVPLLVVVVVAGGFRLHAVMTRPIPPDLALGFYDWEPGGVRWTRGNAVLNVRVEGRVLRLALACPIPQVRGRPQTVSIRLDRAPVRQVTLDTPAWKTVEIPVDKPVGSTALLQLRVGYTFVPAALGLNDDPRRLGILMKPLAWAEP